MLDSSQSASRLLSRYSETSVPWFPSSGHVASEAGRVCVEVIDTIAGLDRLIPEWQDLEVRAQTSATVFQSAAWCRAWIARYVERARIATFLVVTLRDAGRLALVWPICIYRTHGLNEGRWLGEPMSQYGDVLTDGFRTGHQFGRVWQALLNRPDIDLLNLRKVRDDAAVRALPVFRPANAVRNEHSVHIDLRGFADYADYVAGVRSRIRRERARKRRRLAKNGPISFEVLTHGAAAITAIKDAIAFKEAWLNHKGLSSEASMMADPFAILTDLAADGDGTCLAVSRLAVAQETAALEIGFRWNGGYYAYLGAFNPKFARFGAGTVQMEATVEWCIQNRLAFYDLFAPVDAYKLEWGRAGQIVSDYAIATSLKGSLYVEGYLKRGRPLLKKVHRRLPVEWRKRLIRAVKSS